MDKLLPCPFCGGTAKLSAKDHLWIGFKGDGRGVREYLIRAICNKCKARGPVIATGPVNTMYYCYKRKEHHVTKEDVDALSSAESKAIAAWNRRAEPENKQLLREVCKLACESVEREKKLAKLEAEVEHALREKAEREKGCDLCKCSVLESEYIPHNFQVFEGGLYYADSQYGLEGIAINFCPMCGKAVGNEAIR